MLVDGIEIETVVLELTTCPLTDRSARAVCRNTDDTVFNVIRGIIDLAANESVDTARYGPTRISRVRNANTQFVGFRRDNSLWRQAVG